MKLPMEHQSENALAALRDDFCFYFVILTHAVRKDLKAFSFSDLRYPIVFREKGLLRPCGEALAIEMAIFQDHVYDRITLLAQNTQMLREVWGVNERTRAFRQTELKSAETAQQTIEEIAALVSALNDRDEASVLQALGRSRDRRTTLIDRLLSKEKTELQHGSH
jgi:hypothetical protein